MVLAYGRVRRSLRRILPTFDFGNTSRKRTSLGTLYPVSCRRQCAMTSASVSVAPGFGHEQPYCFAGLLVRPADAGAFGNTLAGGDNRLDLVRVNVEARDDDHILLAIDDTQEAPRVEHADVAGAEVAVGGERRALASGFCQYPLITCGPLAQTSPASPSRAVVAPSSSLMSVDGNGNRRC